ncbi:MAG: hypothetical protein ACKO0Z_18215 [Betaproteobacteria bacterium]
MPSTFVYKQTVVTPSGTVIYSGSATGNMFVSIDEAIEADATTEIICALDVSAVTGFLIASSVNCEVRTNDADAPADTIELVAGTPYVWTSNSYSDFVLGTDVTKFCFVVAGDAAGTVAIQAVCDPTPA